jgi:hypothetical protein
MLMQQDNMLYEFNYVVESNNQYDTQMPTHIKTKNWKPISISSVYINNEVTIQFS